MHYGFKPNPKQLVTNKAKALFGRDVKVNVTGTRPSPEDAKTLDIPSGMYYTACFVNDKQVAVATNRNWRKAYNLLVIEVEKAFTASVENGVTQ